MIIEYIGLPGSGKTTLAFKEKQKNKNIYLRSDLQNEQIDIIDIFSFILKRRKITFYLFIGTLYNFDINIKKWYTLILGVIKTIKDYSIIEKKINKNSNTIILMDEGILQRSLSVFCFNKKKFNFFLLKQIISVLLKYNLINKVYYIKVKSSTAIERCKNRSNGFPFRYSNLNSEKIASKFDHQLECYNVIASYFNVKIIINE